MNNFVKINSLNIRPGTSINRCIDKDWQPEAADYASISRLYGAIHSFNSLNTGKVMGKAIGRLVIEKLD